MRAARLPVRKRVLYLLALAQLPGVTLLGFLIIARGGLALPGQSAEATAITVVAILTACLLAALPAWFVLRMGCRPAWWKGALIPGSSTLLMFLGVNNYARRNDTGLEVDLTVILATSGLLLVLLGIPGAIIGARMARAARGVAV